MKPICITKALMTTYTSIHSFVETRKGNTEVDLLKSYLLEWRLSSCIPEVWTCTKHTRVFVTVWIKQRHNCDIETNFNLQLINNKLFGWACLNINIETMKVFFFSKDITHGRLSQASWVFYQQVSVHVRLGSWKTLPRKILPRKIPSGKFPPENYPRKIPPGKISP